MDGKTLNDTRSGQKMRSGFVTNVLDGKALKNRRGGLKVPGVLLIVFLVLKLTGNIDWSWAWVTSPVWMAVIVATLMLMVTYPFSQKGTIFTSILYEIGMLVFLGIIAVIVLVIGGVLGPMSLVTIALPLFVVYLIISAIRIVAEA